VAGVFIAHAPEDGAFAADLRHRLEDLRVPAWTTARELRPGSRLAPELETAIGGAAHVLVVLSPSTVNSRQVRWEIGKALETERNRSDGFRVVPLLLPGIAPDALDLWFPERPLAVEVGPGGLSAALPALLAALGRQAPDTPQPFEIPEAKPVEELILRLTDPRIVHADGKRRACATATLTYEPARSGARNIESLRYPFTAPLGPIEAADLRWYLEDYHLWPVGVFTRRAEAIQRQLPAWGGELYAALAEEEARAALTTWQEVADGADRRFSVMVYGDLPRGATEQDQAAAREAATELLSLPWELLHDGHGWLFQGREPVRVRRRLPNRRRQPERPTALPVRILLVSPRPEVDAGKNPIDYLDHRVSARPLVEAVENLGELARLTVLQPPTYDRELSLGGLCFEDPAERERRLLDFVDAVRLAGLVRRHRIPLVFLEACQTAMSELDPTASVAARLLDEGVTSVVAMSHSVLVETARRFVQRFYAELARGARVGAAMLAGQQELYADQARGRVLGAGDLRMQDWFVPVLYQEEQDPQLITRLPPAAVQRLESRRRRFRLGDLPAAPEHRFRGRSRELLGLERLLHRQAWVVVRGTGGQGKTTLAIELARWLVRTGRFDRAAFVSLEHHRDARAVLDAAGHQLVGPDYTVARYPDLDQAAQPVHRALTDRATIVVLDNCESVLPDPSIFGWCRRLLDADPRTRIVFTSRESLPEPFGRAGPERELGALARPDAVELVGEVMKRHDWTPPANDAGEAPQQIIDLVEAVDCHARALVLLAREVGERGVTATTAELRALMDRLAAEHPGDRENSLYASVELSLRRLSPTSRQHVPAVAVCHGGIHLLVLELLTGLPQDDTRVLAVELIEVGLGEDMGDGHLRLDPGLAPYLLATLPDDHAADLRARWAEVMTTMAGLLASWEFGADADRASRLTRLELRNLVAMVDEIAGRRPPEEVVAVANVVEGLLADLGRPAALEQVIRVREAAAAGLTGWSEARFRAAVSDLFRIAARGDLEAAHLAAEQLVDRCFAAGADAYPKAAQDIAAAYHHLGRIVNETGDAEAALVPLAEAQRRARELAGDDGARLTCMVTAEIGNSLLELGRLTGAGDAYQEAIDHCTRTGDIRAAAVFQAQLGTVRMEQHRYDEALRANRAARDTFQELGEPLQVAGYWYQIGLVHHHAGRFEDAERAYRESLAIRVREADLPGQAASLLELGSVYTAMGRHEESAAFSRQSAELFARVNDRANEGRVRGNLAKALTLLDRFDEARPEIHRSIACLEPYGQAVEPWLAWNMLEHLEEAAGRPVAAAAARERAMRSYLAYRRAGGATRAPLGRAVTFFVGEVLRNGRDQAVVALDDPAAPDGPPWVAFKRQLRAVLTGDREQMVAGEAALDALDAVELRIMAEVLGDAGR
jgi:tetratricopeptide (TPR) repeat protein